MERTLDVRDVDPDPISQFRKWFDEATKEKAIVLPEAMTLGTVSAGGKPSVRVVLLKEVDNRGFVFYTNYMSPKSEELAGNAHASLVFWWGIMSRQVRVDGAVEKTTPAESDAYFATRPRESQIGGHASPQSRVIASRDELDRRYDEIEKKYRGQPVPRPAHWGGYRVIPERVEFWQGREARLHDRVLYELQPDGKWRISRLAP